MKKMVLAGVAGIALISIASADYFAPSNTCMKPNKPYQFNSQWEVDNFNAEVQRYRRCIEDFVEKQNQAADYHSRAASQAIEEWNRFVRLELN